MRSSIAVSNEAYSAQLDQLALRIQAVSSHPKLPALPLLIDHPSIHARLIQGLEAISAIQGEEQDWRKEGQVKVSANGWAVDEAAEAIDEVLRAIEQWTPRLKLQARMLNFDKSIGRLAACFGVVGGDPVEILVIAKQNAVRTKYQRKQRELERAKQRTEQAREDVFAAVHEQFIKQEVGALQMLDPIAPAIERAAMRPELEKWVPFTDGARADETLHKLASSIDRIKHQAEHNIRTHKLRLDLDTFDCLTRLVVINLSAVEQLDVPHLAPRKKVAVPINNLIKAVNDLALELCTAEARTMGIPPLLKRTQKNWKTREESVAKDCLPTAFGCAGVMSERRAKIYRSV